MKSTILFAGAVAWVAARPLQQRADTSQCPYYLPDGGYEFPHLIIPYNNSDTAIGPSYFAEAAPNDCGTVFNFDIPQSRANQQCSVYFTLPRHDQLATSNFRWDGKETNTEGPGTLELVQYQYNTGASSTTTDKSLPPQGPDPPVVLNEVTPGNSYKVWTGSCGPGGVMSWGLSSPDSSLMYFQDWNPCAIGVWVVYENTPAGSQPSCGHCPDKKTFSSHVAWLQAYTGDAGMDPNAALSAMNVA